MAQVAEAVREGAELHAAYLDIYSGISVIRTL